MSEEKEDKKDEGEDEEKEEEKKMDKQIDKIGETIGARAFESFQKKMEGADFSDFAPSGAPAATKQRLTPLQQKMKDLLGSDKKLTPGMVSGMGSKEKIEEFARAMLTSDHQKLEILSEGTAAMGGYLVPEEWEMQIIKQLDDESKIRDYSRKIRISTDTLNLTDLVSGAKAKYRDEAAVKESTSLTFGTASLTPYSCAGLLILTDELVEDAQVGGDVTKLAQDELVKALRIRSEKAFVVGSGASQPTGFTTYTPRWTKALGGTLGADNIVSLFYGLPQAHRKNAVFVMATETVASVQGMLDTTGRPIFNDAMTADGLPTLKGRPILESNDVSINNIYFVDLNYYWIAVKRGMEVRVSNQATVEVDGTLKSLWQRNLTGVIVEERHDGELVTEGALASLTGIRT